jgi:hypothetical protein
MMFPVRTRGLPFSAYLFFVIGQQLFERNKNLEEDALLEEGTVSVDFSQYERTRIVDADDENERITFSDSD